MKPVQRSIAGFRRLSVGVALALVVVVSFAPPGAGRESIDPSTLNPPVPAEFNASCSRVGNHISCSLAFSDPDYVKIVWTLRADPLGEDETIFRMETRACATDAAARSKFRLYWALASPGLALLRRLMLAPLTCEAERRAKKARSEEPAGELRAVV